jgi:hypothetical protein
MTLILPGVEIKVVKEIVLGQLRPAGILGLLGITEDNDDGTPKNLGRVSSYKALKEQYGRSVDFTVPEAKQSFQNGIAEIVMVPLEGLTARKASTELRTTTGKPIVKLEARAKGFWGNRINVKIEGKPDDTGKISIVRVTLRYNAIEEVFDNLDYIPTSDRYFLKIINDQSDLVTASIISGGRSKSTKKDKEEESEWILADTETTLSDGKGVSLKDYEVALEKLQSEDDVDLVLPSIEEFNDTNLVKTVYHSVEAHCRVMSENSMNRIGFGQAPPSMMFADGNAEVDFITRQVSTFNSDRFVYVAPHGALGAVVGLIGNLDVHQSPTFKTLSGISELERRYSPSQLKSLLVANVLALEAKRDRGIIIEKGICTSGEQISVIRIADKAVRGIKMIGDKFIGTLNTVSGRAALKEKCVEFFIQLEKDGAIVPSADGSDPAYKVDVYATDDDISKGIVRIDIAVRPVRAIDYIYGTILVRA